MRLANGPAAYGAVAKALHWATALLVLTLVPLGLVAVEWPYDTSDALATKARLFTIHKTLGVAVFFLALARIAWALSQPRPAPLHPERRLETVLAEGVHWLLYVSLVAVPASGWIQHAAATGFAPIWWPFGQTLPFVPQSPALAQAAGGVHVLFTKLLMASVALHVAGALKHHLVDRDATLRRMLPGRVHLASPMRTPARRHAIAPALGALALYGVAGALAVAAAPAEGGRTSVQLAVAQPASGAASASAWVVETGSLSFTVAQMGAPVAGSFADWAAEIVFEEIADSEGRHGAVSVTIAVDSLTLGSVTQQARGPEFFDAENHPAARFAGEIVAGDEEGYVARGTLTLAGAEVPVALPFTLAIDGDAATARGRVAVDRRDFGMGESYPDEKTVGFDVTIEVELSAVRARAPGVANGA